MRRRASATGTSARRIPAKRVVDPSNRLFPVIASRKATKTTAAQMTSITRVTWRRALATRIACTTTAQTKTM